MANSNSQKSKKSDGTSSRRRASSNTVSKPKPSPSYPFNLGQFLPKYRLNSPGKTLTNLKNYRPSKMFYIGLLVLALAVLVAVKRDWFIAATVNGSPISNFAVLDRINNQYREQALNQMINEKIILDEAKKQNASVTNEEINQKVTELEQNVGGSETLDSLLTQQGMSREDLRRQVQIQLLIEKLYGSEASVSAEEVNQFISQNQSGLSATNSAGQIEEATEIIKQQKLSEIFSQKFQDLKQQSQVQIYK